MDAKKRFEGFTFFLKQCMNTCVSFVKVLLRLPYRSKLPPAPSDSCIILGNGPSLKQSLAEHPAFFRKHPLVCVNSFSVTEEYEQLKPSYYVILDPGFWMHTGKHVTDMLEALKTKTSWKMTLLLPLQAKKSALFRELAAQNPNIQLVYFNYTVYEGFRRIGHFFYKHNMAMVQSQNVLAASLFLSINAGFKTIYLFGTDHSWHENLYVNDENVVCVKHVHFYTTGEKVSYTPFYKGLHIKETFSMDELFATFGKTFYGYKVLDEYARSRNCTVYNASSVSYIDAFKRIKL